MPLVGVPRDEDVRPDDIHPSANIVCNRTFGQKVMEQSIVPVFKETVVTIEIETRTKVPGSCCCATADHHLDSQFVFLAVIIQFGFKLYALGSDVDVFIRGSREI